MTKNEIIKKYKKLKDDLGKQPSQREFRKVTKISDRTLIKFFGRSAYNKLVEESGDTPRIFSNPK